MDRTNSPTLEPQFHVEVGPVRPARVSEAAMDEAISESFPASDPPAWNPGLARPIPGSLGGNQARDVRPTPHVDAARTRGPDVIDVSRQRHPGRTAGEVITSLLGAVGVVLLAPFAILAVGTPIALAARGLLELILWTISSVPG